MKNTVIPIDYRSGRIDLDIKEQVKFEKGHCRHLKLLHVARWVVNDAQEGTSEFFFCAFLYWLTGSGGREAWGVVYQRGGPGPLDYEFDGPFLTREQTINAIATRGFTDPEQVSIDDVFIMLPDSEDL